MPGSFLLVTVMTLKTPVDSLPSKLSSARGELAGLTAITIIAQLFRQCHSSSAQISIICDNQGRVRLRKSWSLYSDSAFSSLSHTSTDTLSNFTEDMVPQICNDGFYVFNINSKSPALFVSNSINMQPTLNQFFRHESRDPKNIQKSPPPPP